MCTYVYIKILRHKKFPFITTEQFTMLAVLLANTGLRTKYHVLFNVEIPFYCQLTRILANSRRLFEIVLHQERFQ